MKHTNSKKVFDHLEFLGYEIELRDTDNDDDYDTYLAKHASKPNLFVRSNQTIIFVRSLWGGFDSRALRSKEFYNIMNKVNSENVAVKCYYEGDDGNLSLWISAVYYGYDKSGFGNFVEIFQSGAISAVQAFKDFAQ